MTEPMLPLNTRTVKRLLEHGNARITVRCPDQDPVVGVKCDADCTRYFFYMCRGLTCNKRLLIRQTYRVAQQLKVAEDWRTFVSLDETDDSDVWREVQPRGAGVAYEAGGGLAIGRSEPRTRSFGERDDMAAFGRLRPAASMPSWASRLTVTVLETRTHRLHAISEDAMAGEGIVWSDRWHGYLIPDIEHPDPHFPVLARVNMKEMFASFWDVQYGSGDWGKNPWVVSMLVSAEHEAADGQS